MERMRIVGLALYLAGAIFVSAGVGTLWEDAYGAIAFGLFVVVLGFFAYVIGDE